MKQILILDTQKIKFKKISENEKKIYLRRFIRFKYPPDKRNRVFCDILTNHSIEPKISKKIFESLPSGKIDELVSYIWNESFPRKMPFRQDFFENEIRCFDSRKILEDILKIDLPQVYDEYFMAKAIEQASYGEFLAQNYDETYLKIQKQFALNLHEFDFNKVSKILLVEGATEEILIPKFAKLLGFDFEKEGVFIIASGGKNQVVKDYLTYRENLKLPIAVVLDSDAKEQYEDINSILRQQDKIFLIEEGEFEDLLDETLILKALNQRFKNEGSVCASDLEGQMPMSQKLCDLYKVKGFGEFKKVEFAKIIFETASSYSDVGQNFEEIMKILQK